MTPDEQRAHALAGMRAAIEYARIQYHGMSGDTGQVASAATLYAIEEEAKRDGTDLLGSLASITLRAASLAAAVTDGMTVPKFLDLLEAETRGWHPDTPE